MPDEAGRKDLHGSFLVHRGIIMGIMEKKMETTI